MGQFLRNSRQRGREIVAFCKSKLVGSSRGVVDWEKLQKRHAKLARKLARRNGRAKATSADEHNAWLQLIDDLIRVPERIPLHAFDSLYNAAVATGADESAIRDKLKRALDARNELQWAELKERHEQIARKIKRSQPEDPTPREKHEAWLQLVDEMIETRQPIATDTFNRLWNAIKQNADAVDMWKADRAQRQLRDVARRLVDLNSGPIDFKQSWRQKHHEAVRATSGYARTVGMHAEQRVFLDGPERFEENELDNFAESMASGDYNGIVCLAGDRGSGKSTILNAIEYRAQNEADEQSPLLLRIDVGAGFDPSRFTLDTMSAISAAGIEKSRSWRRISVVERFFGHLGRLCQTNRRWAMGALFVVMAIVAGILMRPSFQPDGATPVRNGGVPEDPVFLSQLAVFGMSLLGMIVVGFTYRWCRGRWTQRMLPRRGGVRSGAYMLIAVVALVALLFAFCPEEHFGDRDKNWQEDQWTGKEPTRWDLRMGHTISWDRYEDDLAAIYEVVYPWLLSLAVAFAAVAGLSRSWSNYAEFVRIRNAVRARERGGPADISMFSPLAALLQILLPRPEATEDYADLDMPFLQQHFTSLLTHCVDEFGRVLLIVDDVDVLPSEDFHKLFRVLRPVSKVSGVTGVVAVPGYFYHAMKSDNLSDIHSSVRQCYLVGNRSVFQLVQRKLELASEDFDEFIDNLVPVLESRLRLRIEYPRSTVAATVAEIFRFVLRPWDHAAGKIPAEELPDEERKKIEKLSDEERKKKAHHYWTHRVQSYLKTVGASQREIIREIELCLGSQRRPFEDKLFVIRSADTRVTEEMKTRFSLSERAFEVDVEKRAAMRDAENRLNGDATDDKPDDADADQG